VHFLLIALLQPYPCYNSLHIIIFLHLVGTNHKCTHHCYFLLLLNPAAQKMEMVWNSSMRSSRLALPRLHLPVDYWAFCCCCCHESSSLCKDNIHVIIILYLWYLALLWTLMSVCVEILFLGTHAMSIQFWSKTRYDRSGIRVMSTVRTLALEEFFP
jgi:hypothetical protein